MAVTGTAAVVLLAGRLLFGLVFAFQGVNHCQNVDYMAGYAESKGIPAARFLTVVSGAMLIFGGLAIAPGAYPTLGAGAITVFLVTSTPTMHNFWAVPEEQAESEMTHFLRSVRHSRSSPSAGLSGSTWSASPCSEVDVSQRHTRDNVIW